MKQSLHTVIIQYYWRDFTFPTCNFDISVVDVSRRVIPVNA